MITKKEYAKKLKKALEKAGIKDILGEDCLLKNAGANEEPLLTGTFEGKLIT